MTRDASLPTSKPSPAKRTSPWPRFVRRLGLRRRKWDRQRFNELALTLAWTIPLTLLLWVWAQTQQIDTTSVPGVRVLLSHEQPRVTVSRPGRLEADRQSVNATITLRGSRGALQDVARELRGADASGLPLALDLEPDDRVAVDLKRELNDLPLFEEAGVTVDEVVPASVEVSVEPVVELPVPVGLATGGLPASEVVGEVAFEPATVTISGPQATIEALNDLESRAVLAQVPTDVGVGRQTASVRVELSPAARERLRARVGAAAATQVTVAPATVTAQFERRDRQLSEVELPSVPIWITKPAAFEERYSVDLDQPSFVLNRVRVRGPADVVRRLASGDLRDEARARLPVLASDRETPGTTIRRPVVFELPPDVEVIGDPPEVAFTLRPIAGELP